MEKRSFQQKLPPVKNSKQRFKPPSFLNEEQSADVDNPTQHPQYGATQSSQRGISFHTSPLSGRAKSSRVAEKGHFKRSGNSISGDNVLEDEVALILNSQATAQSLPDKIHLHGSGSVPTRNRAPKASGGGGNGLGNNDGKGGENSPADAVSLYSDEIPSGYNSGEQYDTVSTGYMSGEAYELPATRMDLLEPSLDVIDESRDNVGAGAAARTGGISKKSSDDEEEEGGAFLVEPPPPVTANSAITGMVAVGFVGHVPENGDLHDNDKLSITSSSDSGGMLDSNIDMGEGAGGRSVGSGTSGGPPGGVHYSSPINYGAMKNKPKKKVTTFAVPIEASPLATGGNFLTNPSAMEQAYMDESSDAAFCGGAGGIHLSIGGYRTVPSDTDTTDALESDGNAIVTETGTDSGTDNRNSGVHRPLVKTKQSKKDIRRSRRKMENHDDAWFMANDNKYWKATRFICFWGSILSMLLATLTAGVLIALMPRDCNPEIDWYHGTVTLDITPTMQQGNEWKVDLQDLTTKLVEYHSLGIQTIHLRDISKKQRKVIDNNTDLTNLYHPTNRIISLAKDVMNETDNGKNNNFSNNTLRTLTASLHKLNMTLMVQIPIVGKGNESEKGVLSLELQQDVSLSIQYFMQHGADGIFLDGLEHFGADKWVSQAIQGWRSVIDQYGITNRARILMTSYKFAHNLEKARHPNADEALQHISLLDATLDLLGKDGKEIILFNETSKSLDDISAWDARKGRPWINWNLNTETLPLTNAALAFHMLLPGTINIGSFENNGTDNIDVLGEKTSLGNDQIRNMTSLRAVAVPIYMNGNYKRCDCPEEEENFRKETNYLMHQPINDVVQLERFYSRRHRFVLVANFGRDETDLAPIGRIYSGGELVLDTSNSLPHLLNTKILFKSLTLSPGQAVVIKLPK